MVNGFALLLTGGTLVVWLLWAFDLHRKLARPPATGAEARIFWSSSRWKTVSPSTARIVAPLVRGSVLILLGVELAGALWFGGALDTGWLVILCLGPTVLSGLLPLNLLVVDGSWVTLDGARHPRASVTFRRTETELVVTAHQVLGEVARVPLRFVPLPTLERLTSAWGTAVTGAVVD